MCGRSFPLSDMDLSRIRRRSSGKRCNFPCECLPPPSLEASTSIRSNLETMRALTSRARGAPLPRGGEASLKMSKKGTWSGTFGKFLRLKRDYLDLGRRRREGEKRKTHISPCLPHSTTTRSFGACGGLPSAPTTRSSSSVRSFVPFLSFSSLFLNPKVGRSRRAYFPG